MEIQIVVSRYNEDLSWILEEPFNKFQYIVYNKGTNENFEKKNVVKIVSLSNVGKNDHTYLHHIIENYSNLSDITIFSQDQLILIIKKKKQKEFYTKLLKVTIKKHIF
jgi:hypothetical protein